MRVRTRVRGRRWSAAGQATAEYCVGVVAAVAVACLLIAMVEEFQQLYEGLLDLARMPKLFMMM